MVDEKDLIKLVDTVRCTSDKKMVITYLHQYEKDIYYSLFGDLVDYIQLSEKIIIDS